MSESLYLHQSFTKWVSNQYTYTDILTCQMSQQVMECILILFRSLRILHTIDEHFMSEVLYIDQTFTDLISNQYARFDMLTCQM